MEIDRIISKLNKSTAKTAYLTHVKNNKEKWKKMIYITLENCQV